MISKGRYLLSAFMLLLWALVLKGQHMAFHYLGPEHGMQALASSNCEIDAFGHIWISTLDGLGRYNGNKFDFFTTLSHPEMPTDEAGKLYCDSRNWIWFSSPKGLVRFDENRQLQRYTIVPDEPERKVNYCFENSDGSMTAVTEGKAFSLELSTGLWTHQEWLDTLLSGTIRNISHLSRDTVIITIVSRGLLIIDTKRKQKVLYIKNQGLMSAAAIDKRNIFFALEGPFSVQRLDLDQPDTFFQISAPPFYNPKDDGTEVQYMVRASDDNLYFTTALAGLVQYNPSSNQYRLFSHDPADRYSLMDNRLRFLDADDRGNLVITGLVGANFTNVSGGGIQYFNAFKMQDGNIIDTRVTSISEDKHGAIWITTDYNLFTLRLPGRETKEIKLPRSSVMYTDHPNVFHVAYDGNNHMWTSYIGDGVAVYNLDGEHVRDLTAAQYPGYRIGLNSTRIIRRGTDGWLYLGSADGLFRMDPDDFSVDTFPDDPAMAPLRTARIVDILFSDSTMWVATSPGGAAWEYKFDSKKMNRYGIDKGLISERVYCLGLDKNGVAVVGTYRGLSLIYPDGRISNVSKGEGIPGTRIESIVKANDGSLWLANGYNLLRYNESDQSLTAIIGEPHLSEVGFQVVSSTALSTGAVVFGVHRGMIIVDPGIRGRQKQNFEVNVFYKNASGHEILCGPDRPLRLNEGEQNLQFEININNMMLAGKMVYRYRMAKADTSSWSDPSPVSQLNFNLTPGTYALEVQAYNDQYWISAPGPVSIHIPFPWWQRWWVISAAAFGLIGAVTLFFISRIRKYKAELSIARQISELESKAIRAQMNPHFVFNSLNAIQECIVTGKIDEAYTYLSKFSRLLRMVLEHSDIAEVSLSSELEVLSLYVSLEKLRFRDELEFTLETDQGLDDEEVYLPPMLIQPHLENAIWHGLRHKHGEKKLDVTIYESTPGYLDVIVMDNGVGRTKSMELQQSKLGQQRHKSKGTMMSKSRMELLRIAYPLTHLDVIDMVSGENEIAGTQVVLKIPILRGGMSNSSPAS